MSADNDDDNVEIIHLPEGAVRIVLPPTVRPDHTQDYTTSRASFTLPWSTVRPDHTQDYYTTSREVDETSFTLPPWSRSNRSALFTANVASTTQNVKRQFFSGKEIGRKRVSAVPTAPKLDRFSAMEREKESRLSGPSTEPPLEVASDTYGGCPFRAERDRPSEQTKAAAKDRLQDQALCLGPLEPGAKGNEFRAHEDRNDKENVSGGTEEKSTEEKNRKGRTKRPLHSDESSVPTTKGGQSLALGHRTNDDGLKTSGRYDQRKAHMFTDNTAHTKKLKIFNPEANTISKYANRQKNREYFDSSNRDRSLSGPEITGTEQSVNTDGTEQIVNNQTPFITTLSTGITRIQVKRPLPRKERKIEDLHTLADETRPAVIPGDSSRSVDSHECSYNAEVDDILMGNFSFDCLEDAQVSPESEEQLTHLIFTEDTSDNDNDPLQPSESHTDVEQQSGNHERVGSEITSDMFIVDVDSKREIHLGDDLSQSVFSGSGSRDHHIYFTESASESDGSVPISKGGQSSDRSKKKMEVQSSLTESECTSMSACVPMEDNSASDCIFFGHTGHTYSRAMWRSMSADAGHVQPSFGPRTPLHDAFYTLERELSGSTSSDEEDCQRQSKRFTFFGQFRGAGKTSSKWAGNKHVSNDSTRNIFRSENSDNRESCVEVLKESDHKNTERYLHAALALADTTRRRPTSASDFPCASEDSPLDAESTDRKETKANSTYVSNASSPADSLTSDSPRSARLTGEKMESESASSSADSVNTVYFVPKKTDNVNSSAVTQGTKRSQAGHRTSQCTYSLLDLGRLSGPKISDIEMKVKKKRRHGVVTRSSSSDDSDTGRKTPQSRSSSNGFLTSESEIGPLVTFPRSRKTTWGAGSVPPTAAGSDKEGEAGAESDQESVTAVELRRRYSSEEFVPASPYAGHLQRKSSNLSDGGVPLFLQRPSRSGHVRQLSLDIGEEFEKVYSPTTLLRRPTSATTFPPVEDDDGGDNVFFGPSTSFHRRPSSSVREERIPLGEFPTPREAASKSSPPPVRKKSHQTSAKLRLLYPNPADPRCFATSEARQREILSTLTEAEVARLQAAGSPLLALLQDSDHRGKKDAAHRVKKKTGLLLGKPADDSATIAPTDAAEVAGLAALEAPPHFYTDPRTQHPAVTVQPTPRVKVPGPREAVSNPPRPPEGCSNLSGGRDVVIAIPTTPPDVRFDRLAILPPSKRRLLPNPFNRINQRCHSTLQCPCCFFFCFFCCSPALTLMERSDYEFDYGSLEKARYYGRRTTVLYVAGAAVAVCLLVAGIVVTVVFLQELLLARRGWP